MSPPADHRPCSVRGCWETGTFGMCTAHAASRPYPVVALEDARRSPAARRERDRQLGRWAGLSEDELPGFLRDMALFDLRTEAWDERLALQEAETLRARRRALEGGELRAPRIFPPSIPAPRAA